MNYEKLDSHLMKHFHNLADSIIYSAGRTAVNFPGINPEISKDILLEKLATWYLESLEFTPEPSELNQHQYETMARLHNVYRACRIKMTAICLVPKHVAKALEVWGLIKTCSCGDSYLINASLTTEGHAWCWKVFGDNPAAEYRPGTFVILPTDMVWVITDADSVSGDVKYRLKQHRGLNMLDRKPLWYNSYQTRNSFQALDELTDDEWDMLKILSDREEAAVPDSYRPVFDKLTKKGLVDYIGIQPESYLEMTDTELREYFFFTRKGPKHMLRLSELGRRYHTQRIAWENQNGGLK